MPEELVARFEELTALESEFEDVESEISKSRTILLYLFWQDSSSICDALMVLLVRDSIESPCLKR
jgi:hypothetical protein